MRKTERKLNKIVKMNGTYPKCFQEALAVDTLEATKS